LADFGLLEAGPTARARSLKRQHQRRIQLLAPKGRLGLAAWIEVRVFVSWHPASEIHAPAWHPNRTDIRDISGGNISYGILS
jgi:hypothetical protein